MTAARSAPRVRRITTAVALAALTVALVWSILRDAPQSVGAATHPSGPVQRTSARSAAASSARPIKTSAPRPAAPSWQPCANNADDSLVVVSIARQQLAMCDHTRLVDRTPVTTGMAGADNATPTGVFHIQGRNRDSLLTQADGRQYPVKYWIPFDAPAFGFHDAPWQTIPFGSAAYRTGGSHGCVHVPAGAITRLFDWVDIGTTVRITP